MIVPTTIPDVSSVVRDLSEDGVVAAITFEDVKRWLGELLTKHKGRNLGDNPNYTLTLLLRRMMEAEPAQFANIIDTTVIFDWLMESGDQTYQMMLDEEVLPIEHPSTVDIEEELDFSSDVLEYSRNAQKELEAIDEWEREMDKKGEV